MRGNPKPSSIYWHHQLECYFNSTLKAEKENKDEKQQKKQNKLFIIIN
jgi:hypothetical protein